jgi:hypothetical protein
LLLIPNVTLRVAADLVFVPITPTTIKRLFARSGNKCALPRCAAVLVEGEHVVAEICHIRARRKAGPRFDPTLSSEERDSFGNLLLLCPTCHTLVDKDRESYSTEVLTRIKIAHEQQGSVELTPAVAAQALKLFASLHERGGASASARSRSIAVSIGGDNHAPINITHRSGGDTGGYPPNSIGADANLSNYIEYLCGLWVDYTALIYPDENQRWILIGAAIKRKFRLKKRKRGHISAERFRDLVRFLIDDKLARTRRDENT